MTQGRPPATHDDQIALDAGPCGLTVTFGFGPAFFTRTGLAHRAPAALVPVPGFPSNAIDPKCSDGDLWIRVGADDPLVAFHALHVLQREAAGAAAVRWQMSGFNRSQGATAHSRTVRNLMGQLDGTGNPQPTDKDFAAKVFVPDGHSGQARMNGGSYAVVRRIRMRLDHWADLTRAESSAAARTPEPPCRPPRTCRRRPHGPEQVHLPRLSRHPRRRPDPRCRTRVQRPGRHAAPRLLVRRRLRPRRAAGMRDCCSSPGRPTPPASSRCRRNSTEPITSPASSATSPAPSSPSPAATHRANTSASPCWRHDMHGMQHMPLFGRAGEG